MIATPEVLAEIETKKRRGGARPGAGRHPKDCACDRCAERRAARAAAGKRESKPLIGENVCLTDQQWNYLNLWLSGGNPSECVRELLDLAMRFWPAGPGTAPFTPFERRLERWAELADERGLDGAERERFFAENVPGYGS